MLTKVLFTILVIAAVMMYVRHRSAARLPDPGARGTPRSERAWRLLPGLLLLATLGVGALVFWLEWQEEQRIFTARVIDTRSGEVRNYLVYRDGVRGRRFTTIDGRTVTLADVERMELIEGDMAAAAAGD